MREIQPRTAAIAVQAHGKTIATIITTMEGITIMTAAAQAVQALAVGVDAAAVNKVKKLV
jgi:hypothetical protein